MSWRDDIAREKLRIKEATREKIVDVTLRFHGTLVSNPPKGTPIDMGWASANWFISVGGPTQGNTGTPTGMGDVAARDAQQSQSVAEFISTYRNATTLPVVHVGNNVPYINRLNNGWSDQSPAGFVNQAVQEAVLWANNNGN